MTRTRTVWDEGTEPGRQVVALGVALALTAIALDLVIGDGLAWIFDIGFVMICVALALRVRPEDFFPVAVLPPLLMLGVFWLIGLIEPSTIADDNDGAGQAALSGMAHHSGSLLIGYALCLSILEIRRRRMASGLTGPAAHSSKRSGSPAPRRTTVGTPSE